MIYIDNKFDEILFPKHATIEEGEPLIISLRNNLTQKQIQIDGEDISKNNRIYQFKFPNLIELEEGEYRYEIISKGTMIESGLICTANYKPEFKSHHNESEVIQYDPDKKI